MLRLAMAIKSSLGMAIKSSFAAALLCVCWLCMAPISADLHDFVYGLCNTATFASNSSFSRNLNTVIGVLSQRSSSSLFHNATVIPNSSPSSSDNAYGFFQCRGDISLSDCSTCVNAIVVSGVCSSAVGRRIQLEGCFLRYESYNFFDAVDYLLVKSVCSHSIDTNASFRTNLASLLKATAEEAPTDGGFYASGRGSGDNTAYTLAQCLAYLSPSQCATCLVQISVYNTMCPNAIAGDIYYTTCYYRYSNVSLTLSGSTSSTPGLAPPFISPDGGKINTRQDSAVIRSRT